MNPIERIVSEHGLMLLDGAFSASLVHREAEWFEDAGRAARALVAVHPRRPATGVDAPG